MPKSFAFFAVTGLCLLAGFASTPARAEWSSRVFAPYMYLGAGDKFKLTDWAINRDTDVHVEKSSNVGSGIDQKTWDFTRIFQKFQ